jgi:predicted nucleic acid-binding protein
MICVDASVAAKWVFDEEHFEQARALYHDAIISGDSLIAPPLLRMEITNIIRQRMRRAKPPEVSPITSSEAREVLRRFLEMSVGVDVPRPSDERALELAIRYELSPTYDAYYLALSELLDCELWTADRRLYGAVGGKLPLVRWIGDFGQS